MKKKIKILLLDDDEMTNWISTIDLKRKKFFGEKPDVTSITNIEEAKKIVRKKKFDLAIVDIMIGSDYGGLGFISFLKKELKQETKIIIKSGKIDDVKRVNKAILENTPYNLILEKDKIDKFNFIGEIRKLIGEVDE